MARLGRGQSFQPQIWGVLLSVADATVALSGQSISASQGSVVTDRSKALSGLGIAGSLGTISPALAKVLSGQIVTGAQGTVVFGNGVAVALTGQALLLTPGSLSAAASISLVGDSVQADAGSLAPSLSVAMSGALAELGAGVISASDVAPSYPDVAASRSIRLPAGGIWVVDPDVTDWCEIIWSDALPAGVTLSSVAWTLPGALASVDEVIEQTLGKAAIKISGATHASMNQIAAVATLSNGVTLAFTAPLRCFNG